MDWKSSLEAFERHLRLEKNYSLETLRAYFSDLKQWQRYFLEQKLTSFEEIQRPTVRKFWEAHPLLSSASVQRKLAALKTFLIFLRSRGEYCSDPENTVVFPKSVKPQPHVLNQESMELFLETAAQTKKFRNYLLCSLLYHYGLRVSEVCSLNQGDISWSRKEIRLAITKGGKTRVIPVLDQTLENLKTLLNQNIDASGAVFQNRLGKQLTTRSVVNIVKKLALEAGFDSAKISPHTLRHSCATHLLNNGTNLKIIQDLLGHETVSTTQKYTHLEDGNLIQEYDKNHPLATNATKSKRDKL